MDKEIAFANLAALASLLRRHGIRVWLDGGSLLGCVRDGDLIDHDLDTDLGVPIGGWHREAARAFLRDARAAGFTVPRYFGDVARGLEICLARDGVHTDLFFYYPEGDRVWCGAWTGWCGLPPGTPKTCRLIKYLYEPFELRTLTVKGVDFLVPADTERFLVTLYGERWRIPDPTWNGMVSPPNAVMTSFVIERDPTVVVEEELLDRVLPGGVGDGSPDTGSDLVGVAVSLQKALLRARARRREKRPPEATEVTDGDASKALAPGSLAFCHRGTLRCDDDPASRHHRYSARGADSPLCCASHLVEILFAATSLFEANGIPYFILWGTHLGAVRHRGLIPWDTDVDLGVFLEDYPRVRALRPQLEAQGFHLRDSPRQKLLTLDYSPTNRLHLDIEVWHREAGGFRWDQWAMPEGDLLPLRRYPFYDRLLSGPRSLQYLLDYYGDDCLELGRKQWLGWDTPSFDRERSESFPLAGRAPAPIDLDRDYAAEGT